ncbi:hypothetical protein WMY93_019582 [Mugilogobius chulae]|uniref:SEFIR domain-containing protein n=1 Tax=Mugilogobius chulae TaxID=88201 RepID=A0AAW0NRU5_9GOBI
MARVPAGSAASLVPVLTLIFGLSAVKSAHVLPGAKVNCSQQGLNCSISFSNCLDPGWAVSHSYTPSGPEKLDLRISTRLDSNGHLQPVINATWKLKDDGSIIFLKASELQVHTTTNQNLCVRYSFNNTLPMRNDNWEQWTLTSDVVVVEPSQVYIVSVENIPKAELDHSISSVSKDITVPDCSDSMMRMTQPCIESGFLWSPNISVSHSGSVLTVEFSPDPLSDHYSVLFRCGRFGASEKTPTGNSSRLSVSFNLNSCCKPSIEVLSHFPGCGNDCRRHRTVRNICPVATTPDPVVVVQPLPVALGVSSAVILVLFIGVCVVVCRKKGLSEDLEPKDAAPSEKHLDERPTLLLIYSRDHPLYVEVVLKLSAFLQGHCGVVVLLDLLDSSTVSQYGLVRWLELQRQKLRPKDKILVLCSRGVQAKWRSMCGQGHTVQQPDDLIGPFLSLFLSDMHSPRSRGRYIAAFFEDLSSERDIPSFFDIAVKYKLMKHFEELYFRLIEMEKYEPRRINHIQGIRPDEYFNYEPDTPYRTPSQNPDWYQDGETENRENQTNLLLENPPQILEFVPIVKDGALIFTNDVLVNENLERFYVTEPELNQEVSISQNQPLPNHAPDPSLLELQPFSNGEFGDIGADPEASSRGECGTGAEEVCALLSLESLQEEVEEEEQQRSKGQSSASDQGYSSTDWTEPDSDHMMALLRLQQQLMSAFPHSDTM